MTNPYRAMCAELVKQFNAPAGSIPQLAERIRKLGELADRARALLAQPVAEGGGCPGCEGTPVASNSPCAVCGRIALNQPEPVAKRPTDEELQEMWFGSEWFNEGATLREFISITRAVLARWGHQ